MSIDGKLKGALEVFQNVGGFNDADKALLKKYESDITPHIPKLTDAFYQQLLDEDETSQHIEGKLDMLKKTHTAWIVNLFNGEYGDAFLETQLKVGIVHVEQKIPPLFVAASMSYLRSSLPKIVETELSGVIDSHSDLSSAINRVLDLCHFLIDYAYEQDRLDKITLTTGLSRPLLENLIALKRK